MKKLISIILTLTLIMGLCAVGTVGTNAAEIDKAQTSTPQIFYSYEPYEEITPMNGTVYGYLGDADLDDVVSVMDATAIQQDCASLAMLDEDAYLLADVDLDENVSVMDATEIQQFMADMSDNTLITCTVYDDDYIYYTFDRIAEHFVEHGTYDSEDGYYYIEYDLPEYNYNLFMAYYPEYDGIDFYGTFHEPQSGASVATLMMLDRGNPEFMFSCEMYDQNITYYDSYGTAELIDMDPETFDIVCDGFESEYTDDFSEFEEVVSSQFTLAIVTANEMLWDSIFGYVTDIFW